MTPARNDNDRETRAGQSEWEAPGNVGRGEGETIPSPPHSNTSRGDGNPGTVVFPLPTAKMTSVAWLYSRAGKRTGMLYQFRKERSEFGRANDSDMQVEDEFASAHHGAVVLENDAWRIYDFASTNGTFLNEKRLGAEEANPAVLNDGDVVRIGATEMVFKKI